MHAELRLGRGFRVGRRRVGRLMRAAGLQNEHRRWLRGCTRGGRAAVPRDDLVQRMFTVAEPNRLWCADVIRHRIGNRWLYLAVVLNAFSCRVVGWATADHFPVDLVVDALPSSDGAAAARGCAAPPGPRPIRPASARTSAARRTATNSTSAPPDAAAGSVPAGEDLTPAGSRQPPGELTVDQRVDLTCDILLNILKHYVTAFRP